MDVDLSTDLRALLPLIAALVSGHSDVAIGTRLAPGSCVVRGPKRELISSAYNCLLRILLRARFSDVSAASRRSRRASPNPSCPRSKTTPGSSTPSCSFSPSAGACGSTRSRSTGSTTPTPASRSSPLRWPTSAAAPASSPGPASRACPHRSRLDARLCAALPGAALGSGPGLGQRNRAGDHRCHEHPGQPHPHLRHAWRRRARRPARRRAGGVRTDSGTYRRGARDVGRA
jgi:hypothetical protein